MIDPTMLHIRSVMRSNVAKLEAALVSNVRSYVHVWPKYWIGVKVNADVCHGVAVDLATPVSRTDRRVFTNGNGERTILMNRHEALAGALAHARECLATFEAKLAEHEAA